MADDRPLKSAYELAMEKLRTKDQERGIADSAPLTDEQKERIRELREEAQSKLAELEIFRKSNLGKTGGDPQAIEKVEQEYRIDRERIESRLESGIRRVREGKPPQSE